MTEATANTRIMTLGLLEDEAIVLDEAALHLAALDHTDVLLDDYNALLDDIAAAVATLGGDARTARERSDVLGTVIAGQFGFIGDRDSYDEPDNADLIRVIDRRRGLPVSLAILYVGAARRQGWSADALNTPGHVLVRIGSDLEPVLIDPFNAGAVVEPETLSALLRAMLGAQTTPSAEHVAPMENRSVLVRLLMNQARRAEASGHSERAKTLYGRMTVIAPSYEHAWWESARLQLLDGDVPAARSSLSAMLEVTQDARLRTNVCAALEALARH